jgi:hypothetical protein
MTLGGPLPWPGGRKDDINRVTDMLRTARREGLLVPIRTDQFIVLSRLPFEFCTGAYKRLSRVAQYVLEEPPSAHSHARPYSHATKSRLPLVPPTIERLDARSARSA